MADQLSGVAIIIFIAFGVLTFILLFIFAKRQIMRFALKSKRGPHASIAYDGPKILRFEVERRFDVIKTIGYEPKLLKKEEEEQFAINEMSNQISPRHLYRMKAVDSLPLLEREILAVDSSRIRHARFDLRVYLLRLMQSNVLIAEPVHIHRFVDLYEQARHEPMEFGWLQYKQYTELLLQLQHYAAQSKKPCHNNNKRLDSKLIPPSNDLNLNLSNGKPAPVQRHEPSTTSEDEDNNKKATYETSV